MNKFYIICFLLFVPILWINAATYKGNFKIRLEYSTQLDFTEKYELERKDHKIIFNGIILTSEKILLAKKSISYLVMNNKKMTSESKCSAGFYKYTVIKSNEKIIENGCVGTERFAKLLVSFRSI